MPLTIPNAFTPFTIGKSAEVNANFQAVKSYIDLQTGLVDGVIYPDLDGASHPLSQYYATLAAAQAVYPFVTALTQQNQWAMLQDRANKQQDIYLPKGFFNLGGDTLVLTKPIRIEGQGVESIIFCNGSSTSDVIRITPAAGYGPGHVFYKLAQFNITAIPSTAGRHGIHIDLTAAGASVRESEIDHVYINPLGGVNGRSIKVTNPVNTDAFYTNIIRGCAIHQGIHIERCGDSVTLDQNQITLNGIGIEISMVPGAAQLVIRENNITSNGTAIVIHSGHQIRIVHNQIEQAGANTGVETACITVKGDTTKVTVVDIAGNNINTLGNVVNCISVQNAEVVYITKNVLNCQSTNTGQHVNITAAGILVKLYRDNDYTFDYIRVPPRFVIAAGATQIEGPFFAPTLLNGWLQADAVNFPVRYSKDPATGIVSLEGHVTGGVSTAFTPIFNLPTGFAPNIAHIFHTMYFDGVTWAKGAAVQVSTFVSLRENAGNNKLGLSNIQYRTEV